jgi:carboxypeptidase Taq
MSYGSLFSHFRSLGHLQEVGAIVEWDQAVNMPDGAAPGRAEAMATLAAECHRRLTAPELDDWLEDASAQDDLGAWERANLGEMQRAVTRARALPTDLVEAMTRAEKRSEQAWRRYRQENNFAAYAPYLEEVVALKRQIARALGEQLGCSPYDALLDQYEPGITTTLIDGVFAELRAFLPTFTDSVIERQQSAPLLEPVGPFKVNAQRELGLQLMVRAGFDPMAGRLDTSHHPFCGGVPRDVRITTRYDENDFVSALMGVLHETGHAKYEQGLPAVWQYQPVGLARGMVAHESQSLLLEMQVCRSRDFLEFATPMIAAAFPESVERSPAAFTVDNLSRLYTRVRRSFIRVDADEVTYPGHVVLRYDLERALIDGSLQVSDLPAAWDEQMHRLLGLRTLGNDRDGCLQDVHWPAGLFGYFPMYTLGAVVAAQLFAAAQRRHPTLGQSIQNGDFSLLDGWLREAIWSRGSSCSLQQMLIDATGEPLNARHFREHLSRRYLG